MQVQSNKRAQKRVNKLASISRKLMTIAELLIKKPIRFTPTDTLPQPVIITLTSVGRMSNATLPLDSLVLPISLAKKTTTVSSF
jgi:hypothetical protein